QLRWPVKGPLIARYGGSRGVGGLRWQGVVIRAEAGKEVAAVSHGRVAFAEWMRGYGMLLIVDHGDGFMSLYGHNQSLLKEAGDWVQAGEPVAIVGSSGGRSRDGLYFEIRKGGRPVNPVRWCR
ncbi:MAG TPA: peptidoglycan DD-metalloendopeptidase family protein, partial [Gammaproteobacteria bacterium]|nr:peptidoglycan DD-metalloendopeptidase family protein [Gammaproteobacteria bacterium]